MVGVRSSYSTTSAFVWWHWLTEDEPPAKPKLLPRAPASRADVMGVVSHPPFDLWFVVAP